MVKSMIPISNLSILAYRQPSCQTVGIFQGFESRRDGEIEVCVSMKERIGEVPILVIRNPQSIRYFYNLIPLVAVPIEIPCHKIKKHDAQSSKA